MKRLLTGLIAAAFSLALPACSSSGASHALPAGGAQSTPSKSSATLVIRVPKHAKGRSHYMSPSTRSLTLAIAPGAGCTGCSPALALATSLDPGSAGCVDGAAGTTCTIALVLRPGSYLGSIATYDGPLDTNQVPTGALLSKNQSFPMTIAAGKSNVPVISLYGVPHGIAFFSYSSNLGIAVDNPVFNTVTTFLVAGAMSRARFGVYATDVDGSVILGPGAPTFAVSGGFTPAIAGNTVQLIAPAVATAVLKTLTFTATSPACASAASCSWTANVSSASLLAMADHGNNDVVIHTTGINATAPLFATVRTGISNPADVKFDASGNLFVANFAGNTITEYAPPYDGVPIATISTGINAPSAIAFAPNGTLAVANSGPPNVTVYSPPFANATPVTIVTTALSVAFDPIGNLWLSTPASGVQRLAPPFTTVSATASNGVSQPFGVAFDANLDLFVANHGNGTIEKFSSSSYGGAPAATATMSGVSSIIQWSGFIVACGTGAANLYGTGLGAPLPVPFSTTPCHATFDRTYGLWLTDPDDGLVSDFVYPYGVAGYVNQSQGLSQPSAIDVFPGPPPP